jgi:hypothetical protein
MCSDFIVIARVGSQGPAQMGLTQDDEMIHALAPDRSDQPFGNTILPGRGRRSRPVPDAHDAQPACDDRTVDTIPVPEAGITVTLPKPQTSGAKSEGRFGKQDFVYLPEEDAYRCPAGERLPYRYTNEEDGKMLRRYWTTACANCSLKSQCTTGPERRITRWEHEHLLDAAQQRLDANPLAMRQRRETVEHPFGTMKARMGATHFLTKTLPRWLSRAGL